MADNQTIAKGNVTISANADQMVSGMKQAEAKAGGFAKAMNSRMEASLTGFGAGLIGGRLAEGIKKGVEPMVELALGIKQIEEHLEVSTKFLERMEKSMDRSAKLATEWRGAMVAPADKIESIDKQIASVTENFNSIRNDARGAVRELEKLQSPSAEGFLRFITGNDEKAIETQRKAVEGFNKALEKMSDDLRELGQQRERLLDASKDPGVMGEFNRKLKELNDAMIDAPLSANERMIRQFQDKGVPDQLIRELQQRVVQYEAIQEKLDAEKFFKPQRFGILETALQAFDIVKEQVANMKPEKASPMFAAALEKGSAEAYSLDVQNRFGFDTTDAAATQRELLAETKRNTKAAERAYEELRTLNKQLGEAV